MNWITRLIEHPQNILRKENSTPEGLWVKCKGCSETLYKKEIMRSAMVCPRCSHHFRISVEERMNLLCDPGQYQRHDEGLQSTDPLNFKDQKKYRDRLKDATKKAGDQDALCNYMGRIHDHDVSISVFNFSFMGGSMGSVVGEKIVRGMERALENKCPYLLITASGGARMQEGVLSLMQMAKTSATAAKLQEAKLPFICILTDPTMGGVSASVAWLGDIIIAEPEALIGFAGPRVIEETVREKLPEGFQRSEFLLEKGLVDSVVDRRNMRDYLSRILTQLTQRPYAH